MPTAIISRFLRNCKAIQGKFRCTFHLPEVASIEKFEMHSVHCSQCFSHSLLVMLGYLAAYSGTNSSSWCCFFIGFIMLLDWSHTIKTKVFFICWYKDLASYNTQFITQIINSFSLHLEHTGKALVRITIHFLRSMSQPTLVFEINIHWVKCVKRSAYVTDEPFNRNRHLH